MTVNTESIRDAAGVLDILTSQLPDNHSLRVAAAGRAKSCVTALYSAADAIDTQAAEIVRLRDVLRLAYGAMNHMGDVLNGMDAVEEEDEAATGPAFEAVRAALSQGEQG